MLSKDGPVGGRSFHYLVLTNMEGGGDSLLENLSELEFLTLVVSRLSLVREEEMGFANASNAIDTER